MFLLAVAHRVTQLYALNEPVSPSTAGLLTADRHSGYRTPATGPLELICSAGTTHGSASGACRCRAVRSRYSPFSRSASCQITVLTEALCPLLIAAEAGGFAGVIAG